MYNLVILFKSFQESHIEAQQANGSFVRLHALLFLHALSAIVISQVILSVQMKMKVSGLKEKSQNLADEEDGFCADKPGAKVSRLSGKIEKLLYVGIVAVRAANKIAAQPEMREKRSLAFHLSQAPEDIRLVKDIESGGQLQGSRTLLSTPSILWYAFNRPPIGYQHCHCG